MSSSPPPRANIRNLISLFENASNDHPRPKSWVKRTQSMGNLSRPTPRNSKPETPQIDQQIEKLRQSVVLYRSYSREQHIKYQNELVSILVEVANTAVKDRFVLTHLTETVWEINRELNSRLPSDEKIEPIPKREIQREVVEESLPAKQNFDENSNKVEETPVSVDILKRIWEIKSIQLDIPVVVKKHQAPKNAPKEDEQNQNGDYEEDDYNAYREKVLQGIKEIEPELEEFENDEAMLESSDVEVIQDTEPEVTIEEFEEFENEDNMSQCSDSIDELNEDSDSTESVNSQQGVQASSV